MPESYPWPATGIGREQPATGYRLLARRVVADIGACPLFGSARHCR
jgi:hypothetical protein